MIRFLPALLLVACSCQPTPQPQPMPQPDPAPIVGDAAPLDACGRMCGHLREIGCRDGFPTSAGTQCEDVCREDMAREESRLTPAYVECVSRISGCSAEASCQR